ncbi:hypothetical protein [Azospirillum sp. BE72]|uniref:hypothetical protein n=1 Tax=Azospirillum sp. BE72 TaxID=2817776 RepID=UPI0028649CAB|nr:hypothetical protein [Azospirillum sp. BE72]MDR6775339.1 hypothetical protein [Azospirillum sp. BE72]
MARPSYAPTPGVTLSLSFHPSASPQSTGAARCENARLRGRLEVLEPLAATLAASAHREAGGKVKPAKQGSLGLPATAAPPDS